MTKKFAGIWTGWWMKRLSKIQHNKDIPVYKCVNKWASDCFFLCSYIPDLFRHPQPLFIIISPDFSLMWRRRLLGDFSREPSLWTNGTRLPNIVPFKRQTLLKEFDHNNSRVLTHNRHLSVICAAFLWSVPIDKARVDVLDHIRNLLGQFIIWHALTNAEGYVLWRNHARSMSVVANENNVTLFREENCKMRLLAIKYSIKFEEKIN